MTGRGDRRPRAGAWTGVTGTAHAVDTAGGRRALDLGIVLVGGPVVWISYFFVVYLVAEAACTGGGPGLHLLASPVLEIVTVGVTVIAAAACLGLVARAGRARRGAAHSETPAESDANRALAFSGALLSALSGIAVLSVGIPLLVLPPC